ncbi:Ppx/GppA phosphatase-like protein [Elsinoe fawcettii]|nr:Ppx/GppA phosphatase-like protein [Elsinoe fawcettii]
MAATVRSEHVRGIVDMGSNGIRLSLTSLAPPLTRTLPTLYQSRIPISLYDAQYPPGSTNRQPISPETTAIVIKQLLRFKQTCKSFGCTDDNVSILATEATRTAVNAAEYIAEVEKATGWKVTLLAKEDEGRVGAYGVASSLGHVEGLVMDLGGGSTQLSYLTRSSTGEVVLPEHGAVSLPYGAAALSRRLKEAQPSNDPQQALSDLEAEIKQNLSQAVSHLSLPSSLTNTQTGIPIYLSGGGFRGWGYALLSSHAIIPYPIPIINGFSVPRSSFLDTTSISTLVASSQSSQSDTDTPPPGLFRISARRASQVPAVALLIRCLASTLPQISTARFCQGGVREGYLFSSLPLSTQTLSPLVVATSLYARGDASALAELLWSSLPAGVGEKFLAKDLVRAFANTLYLHAGQVKDIRPSSALRFTTTGELAGTHGLSHEERAGLGVLLCERWGGGGELAETDKGFYERLGGLLGEGERWWGRYLGKVGALVGGVYPAGLQDGGEVRVESRFEREGKREHVVVTIAVKGSKEEVEEWKGLYEDEIKDLVKVGKKKNWVGGTDGFGHKVEVEVVAA